MKKSDFDSAIQKASIDTAIEAKKNLFVCCPFLPSLHFSFFHTDLLGEALWEARRVGN